MMSCIIYYRDALSSLFPKHNSHVLTLSQTKKNLDPSKLKEFADNNFTFDENERKFFKMVENTVGKEKLLVKKQFLLFPQCFQKTYTADT